MKNRLLKILGIIVAISLVLFGAFSFYASFYYGPAEDQEELIAQYDITIENTEDGYFLDGPSTDTLFIFYPGAKVDESAYIPMLLEISDACDVFIVRMPYRFAFFGINQADDIRNTYVYENYYIGGHSLGGAMAASYGSKHQDAYDGLILLASYPTKDLGSLSVLSIVGSNDQVVNSDKLEEGKQYTSNGSYIIIAGGNHAQFGNYGVQDGDGAASISKEEQWKLTAEAILSFMHG